MRRRYDSGRTQTGGGASRRALSREAVGAAERWFGVVKAEAQSDAMHDTSGRCSRRSRVVDWVGMSGILAGPAQT